MADAMNTELGAAAQNLGVQDWPPLHYADVVAWSQCVTQMSEMSAVTLNKVVLPSHDLINTVNIHQHVDLTLF